MERVIAFDSPYGKTYPYQFVASPEHVLTCFCGLVLWTGGEDDQWLERWIEVADSAQRIQTFNLAPVTRLRMRCTLLLSSFTSFCTSLFCEGKNRSFDAWFVQRSQKE